MIKKVLIATALLSATASTAFAAQGPAPYVGASLGITANTSTNAGNGNAGAFRGMPLKVFAGYGGVITQSIYLGGEFGGVAGTSQLSNKNNMRTSYGYSASLLPGILLSDQTLAYLRAGVVRSRFSNVNNMATGGEFGVGIQTNVMQDLDLRGEYDYTAYRTVSGISSPNSDAYDLGLVYKFM